MPLLAALPMGALILDHQQRVISTNQAFLDLLGYADAQVIGRDFRELIQPTEELDLADLLRSPRRRSLRKQILFVCAEAGTCELSVAFSRLAGDTQSPPRLLSIILDTALPLARAPLLARDAGMLHALSDQFILLDRECRIKAANATFLAAIDRAPDDIAEQELRAVGAGAPLIDCLERHLAPCCDSGQLQVAEIRETAPDGTSRTTEVRFFPQRDAAGCVTGCVVALRDVTVTRHAERRLLQSAAVYAATSEGVLMTDAEGYIVAVNPTFTRLTGYRESDVLGRKPNLLNSHWHPRSYFVGMWRLLLRQGAWQGEIWNRRKDGEIYLQKLTIRRVLDAQGEVIGFVGVFADRASEPQRRSDYLLHYDGLTKLPNRLLFESRLEHAIELGRHRESPLALLLFDLDHFSHINSSLGHQLGDELLRAVALRLRVAIRPADTLARLRADQFALLFENIEQAEESEEIARRLQTALRDELRVSNHQVFLTASIGIAFDAGMRHDRNAMLAHAESALRLAKRQGRNGLRISRAAPDEAILEHQRLLGRLRIGLDRGDFRLMYRPRVDLEHGVQTGFEVLLRCAQADFGAVTPERFLPLANDSGFMAELGHWTLAMACRILQQASSEGPAIGGLAIAVSESQITRGDLIQILERLLAENPQAANRLDLEFRECLLHKHPTQIAEIFNELHRLGIVITLNEVGSGWLSLAALRRLPIKTLKIYPQFIESLPESRDDLAVVQALVAMAQALDLDILADGVRTEEQRQLLLTIGCQQGQGVLFGEPLTDPWYAPPRRLVTVQQ